jgi:hypothetical protein
MIELLFALVLALVAPATVAAPAVVTPAPRAVTVAPSHAAPADGAHAGVPAQPPAAAPTVPITADSPVCGEEGAVPGQCVQPQLPEETVGRAYG